jgi:hypothetical protein
MERMPHREVFFIPKAMLPANGLEQVIYGWEFHYGTKEIGCMGSRWTSTPPEPIGRGAQQNTA